MVKLNVLEELRTRKEVEDYFKQLGKEITEEELIAIKQSYDQAQKNNETLTMQQLDNVAGGIYGKMLDRITFCSGHPEKLGIELPEQITICKLKKGKTGTYELDYTHLSNNDELQKANEYMTS